MHLSLSLGVLASSLLCTAKAQFGVPLNKAVIQPPAFLFAGFDYDLDQALQSRGAQSWTITPWKNNTIIPQACWSSASQQGIHATTVDVVNVKYDDCSKEWTFCKAQSVALSWETIARAIAKVPLGMRQYSSNILIIPTITTPPACGIAEPDGLILIAESCLNTDVVIHEFGHIMDRFALDDLDLGFVYSASPTFKAAVEKDTHVVTDYANTNIFEDFAELAQYAIMDGLISGGISRYIDASNTARVNSQLQQWISVVRPRVWSGNCDKKVESTQSVFKSNGHLALGTTPGQGVRRIVKARGTADVDGTPPLCGGYPLPSL